MTNTSIDPATIPAHKQKWFWFIMSPLIVVIIACSITVTIAVSNRDDVVIGNYYKEGLLLNTKKDKQELAAQLGLQGSLSFDSDLGEIVLRIEANENSSVVFPDTLSLMMSHPAFLDRDTTMELRKVSGASENSFVYVVEQLTHWENRWYWRIEPAKQTENIWQLNGEIDFSQSNRIAFKG